MKKCPFCAEDIQDAAVKCRHCLSSMAEGENMGVVARFEKDRPQADIRIVQIAASGLLGLLSVVFGSLALITAWIPLFGAAAIPVAIVGISIAFFGMISVFLEKDGNIALPAVGLILSAVAFALPLIVHEKFLRILLN